MAARHSGESPSFGSRYYWKSTRCFRFMHSNGQHLAAIQSHCPRCAERVFVQEAINQPPCRSCHTSYPQFAPKSRIHTPSGTESDLRNSTAGKKFFPDPRKLVANSLLKERTYCLSSAIPTDDPWYQVRIRVRRVASTQPIPMPRKTYRAWRMPPRKRLRAPAPRELEQATPLPQERWHSSPS